MSPPRKFSGKVKPGMGIDGTEGESFTRRSQDPWTQQSRGVEYVPGDGVRRKDTVKSGQGIDDDIGVGILRNKMPDGDPEQGNRSRGGGKDVWDNVNANSDDVSPTRGPGPVRFGVDK
jgi:hypothetical protein